MSKSKYFDTIAILIIIFMLSITGLCFVARGLGLGDDSCLEQADSNEIVSKRDLDGSFDEENAIRIDLNAYDGIANDAYYELNGDLYLTSETSYVLSGKLGEDRQIIVDAKGKKPQIVLSGVEIENKTVAPIYVKKAKKVFLTLKEGSENSISLTEGLNIDVQEKQTFQNQTVQEDVQEENENKINAVIYSKADLTINGSGMLTITAKGCNGVRTSDDLVITSGKLLVTADENAIVGHDAVVITGGDFKIVSSKDGIKSNNDSGKEGKGNLTITGGTFAIEAGDDAIHAESILTIDDGDIKISKSYEGLEGTKIYINGGTIDVVSSDDGINAGGNSQSDDFFNGFNPMGNMPDFGERPNQGNMPDFGERPNQGNMPDFGEKPNQGDMPDFGERPNQGDMPDFGEKPNQGDMPDFGERPNQGDMPDFGERPNQGDVPDFGGKPNQGDMLHTGENNSSEDSKKDENSLKQEEQSLLEINGGSIMVDAAGDGLDSNGDIVINGGTIIVHGPTIGANGALDSGMENGGKCIVNGGSIIALGASDMAEGFDDDSLQVSFRMVFEKKYNAGDDLTISDKSGNIIYEMKIQKSGNSVVFSSAKLSIGDTICVKVGDQTQSLKLDGIASGEAYKGFGAGWSN